jgi:hypothetical protein
VPPRSTALVHRVRYAQDDGGEESVERRDAGGRRPGGGPRVRGQRLERGPVRSGRPWKLQRRLPELGLAGQLQGAPRSGKLQAESRGLGTQQPQAWLSGVQWPRLMRCSRLT